MCQTFLKVFGPIDAGATELYKETLTAGGNVSMVVEGGSQSP